MFYRLIFTLSLISVLFMGCKRPEATVRNISTQQARDLISENIQNPDFIIIDVRTPDEFAAGHLSNAVNIDYFSADFDTRVSDLDRKRVYLIHCKSGARSTQAINIFLNQNFESIWHMQNGFNEWNSLGYPVVQ
jgi:rhodanese-related sulfurtransferase